MISFCDNLNRNSDYNLKKRFSQHGMKGGESENVVVMSDISYRTWKKLNTEPDDEHRVFYVAITRTKRNLFILQPETKYSYDIR